MGVTGEVEGVGGVRGEAEGVEETWKGGGRVGVGIKGGCGRSGWGLSGR